MESMFYNTISDAFAQKTKLSVLKRNGDLLLAGEIVEYSQTNKNVNSEEILVRTEDAAHAINLDTLPATSDQIVCPKAE